jgi:hypothetical protein
MPANKRIRKSPRTAKSLVAETKPAPLKADDLKRAVHRLEVEIVSARRLADGETSHARSSSTPVRGRGYGVQQRLTHAQARRRRARWMMQAGMFLTSTCLLAGAGAWLYRFWQSVN